MSINDSVEAESVISSQRRAFRASSGRLMSRTFCTFKPASDSSVSNTFARTAFFSSSVKSLDA